jgi:tRNA(Ile2) C34 agmatinyltransferase TiaS
MQCEKCGAEMDQTEKDTSSGRDIREYECRSCGHSDWEDRGKALWQILSDDREEAEAARRAASMPPAEPERAAAGSMWNRCAARLARLLGRKR